MSTPRRLLARLRDLMARSGLPGGTSEPETLLAVMRLVAGELVSEVCSLYVVRHGDVLVLTATEGLRASAIGRTQVRVGEGIVGLAAATGDTLNLPDAQNHPAFAYRPETGEDAFASMLAVPVRRAGRALGVIAVQNRAPRRYDADEVEVVETVAMLLAELLAASGAQDSSPTGIDATLPRRFGAIVLAPGLAIGPVVLHVGRAAPQRLIADDPARERVRLERAWQQMQTGIDRLISDRLPSQEGGRKAQDAAASRDILEAYRLVAADSGWLRRVHDAINSGLAAEAAVSRVASELRDRMRRIADPYLRERLADLEDMAGRLLACLEGGLDHSPVAPGAILLARRLGGGQPLGPCRHPRPGARHSRHGRRPRRGGLCRTRR
jgi:phosphotransferase system enzyme I (PtsP)